MTTRKTRKLKNQLPKRYRLYWHIHHRDLMESTHGIRERRRFIRKYKHKSEVPVRLKRMKIVKRPDLLPVTIFRWAKKGMTIQINGYWAEDSMPKISKNLFKRIMLRHRKEYPGCRCDEAGGLVF